MAILTFTVFLTPEIDHTDKRGVAFLTGDGDHTAWPEYSLFESTPLGKRIRHKMKLWIAWQPDTKGKFHRYKNYEEKYRRCFAFIDLDAQIRLYGFTCHPDKSRPSFELVVLCIHAIKKENDTDMAELNRVIKWQNHMATHNALQKLYPIVKTEAH